MAGLTLDEVVDENISKSNWLQMENNLTTIGVDRRLLVSCRLGESVFINEHRRFVLDSILDQYSEEDLLTIGLMLLDRHSSRNQFKENLPHASKTQH